MSKTNFTPGPWIKDYGGSIGHIKSLGCNPKDNKTPTVARYDVGVITVTKEQEQANANLIAAAPAMYSKLQQLADDFNSLDINAVTIEKLLAKARGE